MARIFTTQPAPYAGNFTPKPIALYRPLEVSESPNTVKIEIPWSVAPYTAGAVAVDLLVQGPANPIRKIRSVVIDNTGVEWPVYLKFADTDDLVTCLPNSSIRVPVFTNQLACNIFAPDRVAGAVRITRIFFTNVYLDPLIDYEQAFSISQWFKTPSDPLATVPSYTVPATGDKHLGSLMDASIGGVVTVLLAKPSGTFYITDMQIYSWGLYRSDANKDFLLTFNDFTTATVLQYLFINVGTDLEMMRRREIFNMSGPKWALDATHVYSINGSNVVANTGRAFIFLSGHYTWEP